MNSRPPRSRPRRGRWVLLLIAAAVAAGLACLGALRPRPAAPPLPAPSFPPPPYSDSRYLNARPEAQYVGTEVCATCHTDRHASYLLTAHSRALSDPDLRDEPPDAAFVHRASGRSYRVYRQDGQLRHEEVLRTDAGEEVARVDLPIRYRIGSGRYCRSYLVEIDGFLHESPLTWYTSKQQWGLSPGYDFAQHFSFERPIRVGCAACHAGRVEVAEGSADRLILREKAIGCESCHGPGSLHAASRKEGRAAAGGDDLTIVNPGKLSRPRLEDVCAACHLNGPATVAVRGRRAGDYRPGTPLADYRTDYRFDRGNEQMTVVGHMEQLRQSKCYQQSPGMSCLTCHDPHEPEKPKDPGAFYRRKCLECHDARPCRLGETERRRKQPADDCTACHMPRGDTDIPHIAFTHHRIGLHAAGPPAAADGIPDLVPAGDDSGLPELDRRRNLGLAYMAVAGNPVYPQYAREFTERGRNLLEGVHAAGLPDADTAETLGAIYWKTDPTRAAGYARETLAYADAPAPVRALSLNLLADIDLESGDAASAAALLEEVVRLRRRAEDWRLLGQCYLRQDDPTRALAALEHALSIRPSSPAVHASLAEAYLRLGDVPRAQEHQQKARWLADHHQQ